MNTVKKISPARYQVMFGLVVLILTLAYSACLYFCVAVVDGPPTGIALFLCAPLAILPGMVLAIETTKTLFEIFDP